MKSRRIHSVIVAAVLVAFLGSITVEAIMITVDGKFTDWQPVKLLTKDARENHLPCDWLELYATHDSLYWYIRYVCTGEINFGAGAAYNIYVDSDRNRRTGYRGSGNEFPLGAEYLVQAGTLFVYDGDGISWKWVKKAVLSYGIEFNDAEIAIPLAMIGNPDRVFFFLYGDNNAATGAPSDMCPDNALDAAGGGASLRYSFRGAN